MKKTLAMLLSCIFLLTLLAGCSTTMSGTGTPQESGNPTPDPSPNPAENSDIYKNVSPVTFKFGFLSSQELTDTAHGMIADEIEQLSGGAMKVERYLQGQLYTDDNDGTIAVSEGTCEMIVMGDLMATGAAPEITGWASIPFAFDSYEHCAAFWRAIGEDVNEKMISIYGVRILWDTLELRGPRVICANKPILTAGDFANVKFRLPATAATVASFQALGANPLTSSWSEVYQILQSGVADAAESPLSTFDSISVYEVADYCMRTNHTYSYRAIHVNEAWWQSLDDVQREIIQKAVQVGFDYFNEHESADEDAIAAKWEAHGMKVYSYDEIDVEGIKETVTPVILENYQNEWDPQYWDILQNCK